MVATALRVSGLTNSNNKLNPSLINPAGVGQAWSPRAREEEEKQRPVNVAEQGRQDSVFTDPKSSQQLLKLSIPVYYWYCSQEENL